MNKVDISIGRGPNCDPGFGLQTSPLVANAEELFAKSEEYNVPPDDAVMIALNASGVAHDGIPYDRGRFWATTPTGERYFTALTITDKPFSPFEHTGQEVTLDGEKLLDGGPVEEDTCTDTYWRVGEGDPHRHLTLNSNSRSNCHGCKFCGTYSLEKDDSQPLTTVERLRVRASELSQETRTGDLSELESVGVVTGCFGNEKKLVDHLQDIRTAFGEYGFGGELRYIGSQLRNPDHIEELIDAGKFALHLTVELFDRRELMMKRTKSSLDLESGREVLGVAKKLGADTTFLYIAGLDPLETMEREFPKYRDVLTRVPQVQTFQAYTPDQIPLRDPAAHKLDYFFATRGIVAAALPHLKPDATANYRTLWYSEYAGQPVDNVTVAHPSKEY